MDVNIYPNPSSGKLFVCGMEEGINLTVYNYGGKEIYHSCPKNSHSVVDLGDQPEGVYFVEMRSPKKRELRKIELVK